MEKEFVSYNESLALKELGFDEPCIRGWDKNGKIWYHPDSDIVLDNLTFSQAFRWFREKYGLIGYIQTSYITHEVVNNRNIPCTPRIEFTFGITNTIGKSIFSSFKQGSFKTYEEAELEGLKKLIENFKQK